MALFCSLTHQSRCSPPWYPDSAHSGPCHMLTQCLITSAVHQVTCSWTDLLQSMCKTCLHHPLGLHFLLISKLWLSMMTNQLFFFFFKKVFILCIQDLQEQPGMLLALSWQLKSVPSTHQGILLSTFTTVCNPLLCFMWRDFCMCWGHDESRTMVWNMFY